MATKNAKATAQQYLRRLMPRYEREKVNPFTAKGHHSKVKVDEYQPAMRVVTVPILEDNYSYLLQDKTTGDVAVVDPADAGMVLRVAEDYGMRDKITHVLTTHHHDDHSGGNEQMAQECPKAMILGIDERIPKLTHQLEGGDKVKIGKMRVDVLHVPGHTEGHAAYHVTHPKKHPYKPTKEPYSLLFSGDTLFIGGAGKIFEGTPDQLESSVLHILGVLPGHTMCYVGHEYTMKNLEFAKSLEPDNPDLTEWEAHYKELRDQWLPTVPSHLEDEFFYNPFLRAYHDSLQDSVGMLGQDSVEIITELRKRKDEFE